MWELSKIPGYAEAIAEERIDRAVAFLGLPELIAGISVEPLTARRVQWLRAVSNPFLAGGNKVNDAQIIQFIWMVHKDFRQGSDAFAQFAASLEELDTTKAERDIEAYLERAYLDQMPGEAGRPYYEPAAYIIYMMQGEPFRWTEERAMTTDLRIIYQLLKVHAHANGKSLINRKSDRIAGDWLDELNVITEPELPMLHARIKEMSNEWLPVSNPSPNARVDVEKGIVYPQDTVSWSIAMMRKEAVTHGNKR